MAQKFYAVKKGRSTGIFLSWAECQRETTGFPGAVFKSFLTLEEAKIYLESGEPQAGEFGKQQSHKSPRAAEIPEKHPDTMLAYVDGSYNHVTGEFSYGMVVLCADLSHMETFSEKFADPELASMRNVAGEIKGAEAAMGYALSKGFTKLFIYHDYEGIARWCLGDWKANKEGTKAYKDYYDSIKSQLQVEFIKVAAHTGDHYNEMADKLAKKALGLE